MLLWDWMKLINTRLARIEQQLNQIITGEKAKMATLDDIRTAIAAETNQVAAVTSLLQKLSAALKAAQASEDPAALQALIDQINTDANVLANAAAANALPPPVQPPVAPAEPTPAPAV